MVKENRRYYYAHTVAAVIKELKIGEAGGVKPKENSDNPKERIACLVETIIRSDPKKGCSNYRMGSLRQQISDEMIKLGLWTEEHSKELLERDYQDGFHLIV